MAGQEQGMNIYERASVSAGTIITINLSGTAPPPAAANAPDAGGAPGRAEMCKAAMRLRQRFNRFPDASTSTNGGWWAAFACCFFSLRYCVEETNLRHRSWPGGFHAATRSRITIRPAPVSRNPRTLRFRATEIRLPGLIAILATAWTR